MPDTKMAHTKVHIAGPLIGDVQRCTRCKTRIDGNRTWRPIFGGAPTGWRLGAFVTSSRNGKSDVTAERASEFRPCGRRA